jgi:2-keto-3-deoxy-L-rhamnonate aldolase RhmA
MAPTNTEAAAPTVVLDPTAGKAAANMAAAARVQGIDGLTVGLLDISKPRGDVFLNRLEELLTERGANVARYTKPTFSKPAPVDLRHEIAANCDAVIEALAD